jgi:putative transposase
MGRVACGAELVLGEGIAVGHQAVERLMRVAGIQGLSGRPRYRKSAPQAAATDRVGRQFAREAPDQWWVTDITEHPTREGKVYCAVVLDACSRRVVGWSIDAALTAALVTNALSMAIETRKPAGPTVIHSDQGTQDGSWAFTRRAQEAGLLPSMGAVGTCFDSENGSGWRPSSSLTRASIDPGVLALTRRLGVGVPSDADGRAA